MGLSVNTAEPIEPKLCVGPLLTPGNVKMYKITPKNILIFVKFGKFVFLLYKEKTHTVHQLKIELEDWGTVP